MYLAVRNLSQDKTRLTLSIGGISLAVMLILVLNGFLAGVNAQVISYLVNSPGSLVVAQRGVVNLLAATSLLPPDTTEKAKALDEVERVVPILSQFTILDLHDKKQPAYMIGYDPEEGGGPWELASGQEPLREGEVVFDQVLATRHDLKVGEKVSVLGQEFTISGFSRGTAAWMTSFYFVRKTDVEKLIRVPGATSFLLVNPSAGYTDQSTRQALAGLPGIEALTKDTVAANDLKLFATIFSIPLKLMVGIAFVVGTLIIGLITYTATVERSREYGVLKAMGGRNGLLYRIVIIQSFTAALAGTAAGIILAYGLSQGIMQLRPQFLIILLPTHIFQAFISGMGMSILASLAPAFVLARLAPAEVFRR